MSSFKVVGLTEREAFVRCSNIDSRVSQSTDFIPKVKEEGLVKASSKLVSQESVDVSAVSSLLSPVPAVPPLRVSGPDP